jgi:hypothetical protein
MEDKQATVKVKLSIREAQITCAALLRHLDNLPEESHGILWQAHKKMLAALQSAK